MITAHQPDTSEGGRPEGWPEKCGNCGAPWTKIVYEIVDGFCCHACGACDSDE